MKRLFLLWICFMPVIGVLAQQAPKSGIYGIILDQNKNQPIDLAEVLLFQAKDSTFVKHTQTDMNGSYQFENIQAGHYYVQAKLLGYQSKNSRDFEFSNSPVEVEKILMREDAILLKEAVITGKKPFVEQQADKMVINPDASISTASDNVLDVLGKSPGIIVDKDGNISIKGKSGITILIDDKPTYLSTEQLASMLKNLQATSVERIEIMENPPAKYDAEGSSGVINIRTKRGTIRGFNGSATTGFRVGEKWQGNGNLDLNYRNDKWNIYGGYWLGFNNNIFRTDLTRKFPEGDGSTFKESTRGEGHSTYTGLKLGADYYITKDQVVGVIGRGSGWKWEGNSSTNTTILDATSMPKSYEKTLNDKTEDGSDWTMNLNYRWTIDTLGRNLSADMDYAYYDFVSTADMNTVYIPANNPLDSRNKQNSYTNIFSVKADYSHPFNKKTQLDAGLKSSQVYINSELAYRQWDYNTNEWLDLRKMSNKFKYSENINALYASLKYKWSDSWDMQLGLRGEQTRSEGNNVTIDSITKQDYLNLFPTAFLQRKFSDKHQVNLSYAYRIGRPNYWLLNPFVWMLNPYTYNQGNPLLQPQFTHSVKLTYTLNQKYILSLGYAYTKDQYTQIFEQDDDTKVSKITWRNLNNVNNADATLTIPVHIGKWWQINSNMTVYYIEYKSPIVNGTIDRSKVTFRGNILNTFKLPQSWSIELSGWYMSNSIYGTADFKARGAVDAGVQKKLFNDKGTLKLGVTDIFKSMKQRYIIDFQNISTKGAESFDSRRLQVTFTWRFGQDNIKPARQRSTGLEEEAGRAGK